jgi:hypothetical protein
LTTSFICRETIGYADGSLNSDFQILRKRIIRYSPYRLYREGYISHKKMISKYGRDNLFKKLTFDYFKVETSEGNGVLHILYRGDYLPYNFLVDNWSDIHNSFDIHIMNVDLSDCQSASCYVVGQYVSSQGSAYVRSSQSWNWVFRGFRSCWRDLLNNVKSRCFYNPIADKYYLNRKEVNPVKLAIPLWENLLRLRAYRPVPPPETFQTYLDVSF